MTSQCEFLEQPCVTHSVILFFYSQQIILILLCISLHNSVHGSNLNEALNLEG